MNKVILVLVTTILLTGCAINEKPKDDTIVISEENDANEKKINRDPNETELVLEAGYFNHIKDVNGLLEIQNPDNTLALVNKDFALPGDYVPEDLIRPDVRFIFGNEDVEKSYLRKEAAEALERMLQASESDGSYLYAVSGYRSYKRQDSILQAEIANIGEEQALQAVAFPGKSEHQTGLSMDITSESAQFLLSEAFGETDEGEWAKHNAHRFGFILRYPKDKEKITGYQYEPWHFRYVGEQAASIMYEKNWTLEEFFQHVKKI